MVEASTIIAIVITAITIAAIGFFIYNRRFRGRGRPFFRSRSRPHGRTTPEGEPLEGYDQGRMRGSFVRIAIPVIIGIIVLVVVLSASIKIVEAGNRGVLLNFGAVDTSVSLNEGIHFVTPFRDNVIPLEVRTQKNCRERGLCIQRPAGCPHRGCIELSCKSGQRPNTVPAIRV